MGFWYHNICCPESVTCTFLSQQITCETLAKGSSLMNPDLIREVRPPPSYLLDFSFGSLTHLQYFQRWKRGLEAFSARGNATRNGRPLLPCLPTELPDYPLLISIIFWFIPSTMIFLAKAVYMVLGSSYHSARKILTLEGSASLCM